MLGCFSRRRRPVEGDAPAPVPRCDVEASTSTTDSTSPCSSSSCSVRLIKDGVVAVASSGVQRHGGGGDVGKDPSALSDPGLSSAIASRRFFLASPGRSNSIVDSSAQYAVLQGVGAAGVAVPTYSPDPHADFLSSMEEMAAALRLDPRRRGDRARLHELLLCYLALNHKRTHKYIVSAFTDLLLHLTATGDDDGDELHDEQHDHQHDLPE